MFCEIVLFSSLFLDLAKVLLWTPLVNELIFLIKVTLVEKVLSWRCWEISFLLSLNFLIYQMGWLDQKVYRTFPIPKLFDSHTSLYVADITDLRCSLS